MTLRIQFDRARRQIEERVDQAWTMSWHKFKRKRMGPPFDGEPRFALITVNYSTTRYLKLMLLTLAEQSSLKLLKRIILVDNGSRDGGSSFLRELAERTQYHFRSAQSLVSKPCARHAQWLEIAGFG